MVKGYGKRPYFFRFFLMKASLTNIPNYRAEFYSTCRFSKLHSKNKWVNSYPLSLSMSELSMTRQEEFWNRKLLNPIQDVEWITKHSQTIHTPNQNLFWIANFEIRIASFEIPLLFRIASFEIPVLFRIATFELLTSTRIFRFSLILRKPKVISGQEICPWTQQIKDFNISKNSWLWQGPFNMNFSRTFTLTLDY